MELELLVVGGCELLDISAENQTGPLAREVKTLYCPELSLQSQLQVTLKWSQNTK